MRVLLTGGAGFIGRHVLTELLVGGHDVLVFDSLRPDAHTGPPPQLPVQLIVGDVRDGDALRHALAGVDGVCHLAAKVGLGVNVQDLPDYAGTNDYGTAVLLAAMAQAEVGRLALASSMVVYGEGSGRCPEHDLVTPGPRQESALKQGLFEPSCPHCGRDLAPVLVPESAPADPRNAYAASKLAQENLSAAWARSTGGAVNALRYHNVYGPGLPRHTPYAGVAAIFLSAARLGHAPRVYEDGAQRRDFVHVRDVARATRSALEQADNHGQLQAYNVGSGVVRTVGEMAAELARAVGGPAPVTTGEYRLGDVRHITADSSRLRADLGVIAHEEFAAGMAELAAQV